MNRVWITGVALAGVAGTSGAAFAGITAGEGHANAPQAQPAPTIAQAPLHATSDHDGTITYQVGAAGTVAVVRSGGSLAIGTAVAGAGWTLVAFTDPGAHVAVEFTDTMQTVTFIADMVGDDVVVAVTNVQAVGAPSTIAEAAPISITIIPTPTTAWPAPAPQPASPAPTPAPAPAPAPPPVKPATTQPAAATPQPSATTAPSAGGEDEHDDDSDDGDHEVENHD